MTTSSSPSGGTGTVNFALDSTGTPTSSGASAVSTATVSPSPISTGGRIVTRPPGSVDPPAR